jgi:hypothetical protein
MADDTAPFLVGLEVARDKGRISEGFYQSVMSIEADRRLLLDRIGEAIQVYERGGDPAEIIAVLMPPKGA